MLRHASGFCVEISSTNTKDIYMNTCDTTNPNQKWFWKKRLHNSTTS